jgi:hypothetical protein
MEFLKTGKGIIRCGRNYEENPGLEDRVLAALGLLRVGKVSVNLCNKYWHNTMLDGLEIK